MRRLEESTVSSDIRTWFLVFPKLLPLSSLPIALEGRMVLVIAAETKEAASVRYLHISYWSGVRRDLEPLCLPL